MPAKMDPELRAMARCWKILLELEQPARVRAWDWVYARLWDRAGIRASQSDSVKFPGWEEIEADMTRTLEEKK